jgi:hypothetical protein
MTLTTPTTPRPSAPVAVAAHRDLSPRTARVLVGVIAVLAAALAAVVHLWLFPDGSPNNDDAVYRAQAEALARGQLFLEAGEPARAYQPWFWTLGEQGYVAKYTPTVAAVFAASLGLVGSPVLALSALAATVPVLAYALSRVLGSRRTGAVTAAGLLAASPLVVVQSGMELSYMTATIALLGFLAALLAGLQRGRRLPQRLALLATAGFALSALGMTRPYDAVLLSLPVLGWGLLALRAQPVREAAACVGAFVAGGLPLGVTLLAYNAVATGSPLTLPFGLFSPDDRLGYGERRMFPEDQSSEFGVLDGLLGVAKHAIAVPTWTAGGALLVVLAGLAVRSWWRAGRPFTARAAVGLSVATLAAGYAAFWGPWFAAVAWGGIRYYGPMYALPALVPLVVLTAPLLLDALAGSVRWVRPGLAVAVALSVWQLGGALVINAHYAGQTDVATTALGGLPDDALVLATTETPYLAHPLSPLRNPAGAPVDRFAIAGGAADWDTIAAAGPGRPVHLAQVPRGYYRRAGEAALTVSRARVAQAPFLTLRIDTRQDPPKAGKRQFPRYLVVQRGDTTLRCPVDGLATTVDVRLSGPTGLTGCAVAPPPDGWYDEGTAARRCAGPDCVTVALMLRDERRDGGVRERKDSLLTARRIPVESVGGQLRALVDGEVLTRRGVDDLVVTAAP